MSERYKPAAIELTRHLQRGLPEFDIWSRSQQWRNSVSTAAGDLYVALCRDKKTGAYYDAHPEGRWGHPWHWFRLTEKGRRAAFGKRGELLNPWLDHKPAVSPPYREEHKQPKHYLCPAFRGEGGTVVESRSVEEDDWCLHGGPSGQPGLQIPYISDRVVDSASRLMESAGYIPLYRRTEQLSEQYFALAGAQAADLLVDTLKNIPHVYASVGVCLAPDGTLRCRNLPIWHGRGYRFDADYLVAEVGNSAPWTGSDTPCWPRYWNWVSDSRRAAFQRGFDSFMSALEAGEETLLDRFLVEL